MGGKDLTLQIIIIVAVMIVLVMAAGIALFLIRGRLFGGDKDSEMDPGGVLETMRAMRDRGEISEEEYRGAQAAIVAKASGDKPESGGPDGTGPARAQTRPLEPGEVRAPPGFDLTGAPLPPAVREKPGESGGPAD